MANLACKGLLLTKANYDADVGELERPNVDPNSLIKSTLMTWVTVDVDKLLPTDEDTSIARCKGWYDANDYGKPYCCQMIIVGPIWDS